QELAYPFPLLEESGSGPHGTRPLPDEPAGATGVGEQEYLPALSSDALDECVKSLQAESPAGSIPVRNRVTGEEVCFFLAAGGVDVAVAGEVDDRIVAPVRRALEPP